MFTQKPTRFGGLAALLAALGLVLAACGDRGGDERPPQPGDEAVARVDGKTVWASDVKREAVAQGLIGEGEPLDISSDLFRRVLDEVIDQKLLAAEALARNLDEDPVAQRRLAAARGVALELELADLSDWSWPESTYDVVAAIFIQFAGPELRAAMFAGMKRSLKPGGLLLIEGYRPEQIAYGTGGPRVVENLYTEAMLAEAFAEFEILELAAYDAEIQEGPGHSGMSALVDLVARKPG